MAPSSRCRPPAREARRGGTHLHLRRGAYPREGDAGGDRCQPGHPGSRPDRRRSRQARDFLEGNFKIEVTSVVRSQRTFDARSRSALRGPAAPPRSACARTAHEDQCAHPQGPQAHHRRQEEGREEVVPRRAPPCATPHGPHPWDSQASKTRRRENTHASEEPSGCGRQEGAPQGRRTSPRAGSIKRHVNNTIISITDPPGPSSRGPRPARSASRFAQSTLFAAQLAAEAAAPVPAGVTAIRSLTIRSLTGLARGRRHQRDVRCRRTTVSVRPSAARV